ncbi:hypothetical protein ACLMJK_004506 [Lecanora helva]
MSVPGSPTGSYVRERPHTGTNVSRSPHPIESSEGTSSLSGASRPSSSTFDSRAYHYFTSSASTDDLLTIPSSPHSDSTASSTHTYQDMNGPFQFAPLGLGPLPGRGQKTLREKKKLQWVWPRDEPQLDGHWGYWDRLKDVLTNKGPDIWVAEQHSDEPHHPTWTGWADPNWPRWTAQQNRGYPFHNTQSFYHPARRADWEKYDHRTRRYQMAHPNAWKDVVRSDLKGDSPLYIRFGKNIEWVDPRVDGGRFNIFGSPNPFEFDFNASHLDWYDERHYYQKYPPYRWF